jgi:RNA polymerase sigma-70 factor, ECF subfamily
MKHRKQPSDHLVMNAPPLSSAPPLENEQVVRFRDPVRRFVGSRVRNDALADDLTQEIFIRVLRRLPEVKDHRRVTGWIFQIARNMVADHYRKSRPTEALREADLTEEPSRSAVVEVEEERLRDELAAYVRDVVKTLPPIYREAILLTEYEGMTQVELARHLGLGLSAAKSRVQRAREMVRECVEKCCHVEFDAYGTMIDCRRRTAPAGCACV